MWSLRVELYRVILWVYNGMKYTVIYYYIYSSTIYI